VSPELDAGFLRAIANTGYFGAKLRVVEHVLDVAHAVGPVAEVFASDGAAGTAASAAVTEEFFESAEAIAAIAITSGIGLPLAVALAAGLIAILVFSLPSALSVLPSLLLALVIAARGLILVVGRLAASALLALPLFIWLCFAGTGLVVVLSFFRASSFLTAPSGAIRRWL
jgi:hypothetical protein